MYISIVKLKLYYKYNLQIKENAYSYVSQHIIERHSDAQSHNL